MWLGTGLVLRGEVIYLPESPISLVTMMQPLTNLSKEIKNEKNMIGRG